MLKLILKIILVIALIAAGIVLAALLFLRFYPGVGRTPDKAAQAEFAQRAENFHGGRFHNEHEFGLMTGETDPHSPRNLPETKLPAEKLKNIEKAKAGQLKMAWLGHSSSLIQMGNKNILIDPVLTEYASPVGFMGIRRFSEIALAPADVPEIDALFISHDHYDHLDYQTIKQIIGRVRHFVVPLGVDSYLKGWGVDAARIHTLAWWESIELEGITYTLTPGQHFTGRNPLKSNISLWSGLYMKDGSHSVYYTGDSGYYDVFGHVYETLGAPDLMLAEDGQYDSGWAMVHMRPEESARAAKDVHAKWTVPVHWGTFSLCNHAWDDSVIRMTAEAETLGVNVATPRIGALFDYDEIAGQQERWWEEMR